MPEGDTVWRTATRLDAALRGHVLTVSDLRWPSLATVDLVGRETLEVVPRGKHILHRLSGGLTLHSHLRMEGQWRIERTNDAAHLRYRRNRNLRAELGTQTWTALGLRLGELDLVETRREAELVGHLGPDLLGPDWDVRQEDEAVRRVAASTRTIGEALLDQRNLAGLGTMWTAETLFIEQVHPWTSANALGENRLRAIIRRGQRLLDRARHDAVQSSTGSYRQGENTYVHGRHRRLCRRCGTPIEVDPIGQAPTDRVMFHCPTCQPPNPRRVAP